MTPAVTSVSHDQQQQLGGATFDTSSLGNIMVSTTTAPLSVEPGGLSDGVTQPDQSANSSVSVNSPLAQGDGQTTPASSGEDQRKPLGPIGTGRAARRPVQPSPPSSAEFNYQLAGDSTHSLWTQPGAGISSASSIWMSFADPTGMLAGGAVPQQHFDTTGLSQQHSLDYLPPLGYHHFNGTLGGMDNATAGGMMMTDMYQMDPSAAAMQQMLQSHPAMFMQYPSDMSSGPYNMPSTGHTSYHHQSMGTAPPPPGTHNAAGFMMSPDMTGGSMWNNLAGPMSATSVGTNGSDLYFNQKTQQMMWSNTWTPSANM
jgi:hypothetical protein